MIDLHDLVAIGLDISLNGVGMVSLSVKDGRIGKMGYITNVKKFGDIEIDYDCVGSYFQPKITQTKSREAEDVELFKARRRNYVSNHINWFVHSIKEVSLTCIEGYAISSQSLGLLEMAEISGIVKNCLWDTGNYMRIHNPMSVKLWAVNYGHAKKIHMVKAARGDGFKIPQDMLCKGSKLKQPLEIDGSVFTHDYAGPGTDLADAYHLATMARYEILVKRGLVTLDELTEGQRRVFLRTSKANPVNLLSLPFVVAGGVDELVGNGITEGEF